MSYLQNLQTYKAEQVGTTPIGIRTAGHLQQSHFGVSQGEPMATGPDRFERTGALPKPENGNDKALEGHGQQ